MPVNTNPNFISARQQTVPLSRESIFSPIIGARDMFKDPRTNYSVEEIAAFNKAYAREHKEPWMDTAKELEQAMERYIDNGKSVFSNEGFEQVLRNTQARKTYMKIIRNNCFNGSEHMANVWESAMNNSIRSIENIYGVQPGERSAYGMGAEGYAHSAIHANRTNFNGHLGFTLVGFFAKTRISEVFHMIENGDYPEFNFEYYITYARHPKSGKLLALPKAQRDGTLFGAFDLPEAIPQASPDNLHIIDPKNSSNTFPGSDCFLNQEGLIILGKKGNLLRESGFGIETESLNDDVEITEIWYIADYKQESLSTESPIPVYKKKRVKLRAGITQGDQRLRTFSADVKFDDAAILEGSGSSWTVKHLPMVELISGRINIDTGDYAIAAANYGEYKDEMYTDHRNVDYVTYPVRAFAYKFSARVLDASNRFGGLRFTQVRVFDTMRTTYSLIGTIAVSPYIHDEFNLGAGNDNAGYIAIMTDEMSKQYSITRDLKAEAFLDDHFEYTPDMYVCTPKFGSFQRVLTHDMANVGALGGADPFEVPKKALKTKIMTILSKAETFLNIPGNEDSGKAIARNWVGVGPENKIEAFPDLEFDTKPATNEEQIAASSANKYGFAIAGGASFRDNFNRAIRIIGFKDERWLPKDITFYLKSTDLSFPTYIYFAFMYRIFSGIDPIYTNLPSIMMYGRDGYYAFTQAMVRAAIINQDENWFSKMNNEARTIRTITDWKNNSNGQFFPSNYGNNITPNEKSIAEKIEEYNRLAVAGNLADNATPTNPSARA